MADHEQIAWAVTQLKQMYAALDRLPKKDDFDPVTVSRIKAFLGPWPRALESAGLKEKKIVPPVSRKRHTSEKKASSSVPHGSISPAFAKNTETHSTKEYEP